MAAPKRLAIPLPTIQPDRRVAFVNPRLSSPKTPLAKRAPKTLAPTVRPGSSPVAIEHAILDLQRTAGNAAVTNLLSALQRDSAVATKPATATPAASPGVETIPIDRLDTLGKVVPKHKYDAVAIVPKAVASLPAGPPISVLVHLHGINQPFSYEDALGNDGQVPREYNMEAQLGAYVGNNADTRMIGLLPVGKTTSREIEKKDGTKKTVYGVTFGNFNTEALVDQAIKRLVDMKQLPEGSTANGVVMSAHSGGGLDMLRAASTTGKKRLVGMFGFESINNDLEAYLSFLTKKLAEALKELGDHQAPADASPAAAEAAFQAQRKYLTQDAFRYVGESGPTYRSVYRRLHDAIYGGGKQKGWMVENDADLRRVAGSHYDEIRALFVANYQINPEESSTHQQIVRDRFQKALETLPSSGAPTQGTGPAAPTKSPTPPPGNVAPQQGSVPAPRQPSSPPASHASGLSETVDRIATLTGFGGGWLVSLLGGATPVEAALIQVIAAGVRDTGQLTDLVWYMRHPGSGPIAADDEASKKEWNQIRSTMVRPALANAGPNAPAPTGTHAAGPVPAGHAVPPSVGGVTAPKAPPSTKWKASSATADYELNESDRTTLAASTASERKTDREAWEKGKKTWKALDVKKKRKKSVLTAAEASQLETLTQLKARVSASNIALGKTDVQQIVEKAFPGQTVAWWYSQIKSGSLLGIPLRVHQALAERFDQAEAALLADPIVNPRSLDAAALGKTLGMYASTSDLRSPMLAVGGSSLSMHSFGLAVDLNYTGNPFIGNAGKAAPDAIKRATSLVNNKPIDVLKSGGYATLKKASDALVTYFSYRDAANVAELKAKVKLHTSADGEPVNADDWLAQINEDYAQLNDKGDFAGHKDPAQGFLDFNEAVVAKLIGVGLTWGGTYPGAKDMMHFDLRQGDGAKIDTARKAHKNNQ